MDTIEIVISSPDHGITWNAWLGDEQILAGVHTPVFDACRVLLARGVDPSTKVASRHAGQPYRSLTTTVGYGAAHRVAEDANGPRLRPFKPFKPFVCGVGSRTAADPNQAPGQREDPERPLAASCAGQERHSTSQVQPPSEPG